MTTEVWKRRLPLLAAAVAAIVAFAAFLLAGDGSDGTILAVHGVRWY